MSQQSKPQKNNEEHALHPNEWALIQLLRNKYRFGEVTIFTRDGLPQDILKTIERTRITLSTAGVDMHVLDSVIE